MTSLLKRPGLLLPMLVLLLLCSTLVRAAGLQVSPIMIEFAPGETAQSVWLANTSDSVLHAQVRVLHWTQQEGRDQLEPSRALVASPPLVEIAPGQRQMVRLVRLDTSEQATEQAFRLLIDELPRDPDQPSAQGLSFLLQYLLPVFVTAQGSQPQEAASPPLNAELLYGPDAAVTLTVRNTGTRRARLSNLVLETDGGERAVLSPGLLGYVLAGEQMAWPLNLPEQMPLEGGLLKSRINDDNDERTLLVVGAGL